jgi:hypothetical protein
MDDDDVFIGKFDSRIGFGQPRVVPLFDFFQEQISQHVRRELELASYTANVICRHVSTENSWDVKNFGGSLRNLFIGHGAITSAEINGAGLNLLDAAAAANGLIVDFDVRVLIVVLIKPLGIHGVWESRARTGQIRFRARRAEHCGHNCKGHRKSQFHCCSSVLISVCTR